MKWFKTWLILCHFPSANGFVAINGEHTLKDPQFRELAPPAEILASSPEVKEN
jgi:hypothetical protein